MDVDLKKFEETTKSFIVMLRYLEDLHFTECNSKMPWGLDQALGDLTITMRSLELSKWNLKKFFKIAVDPSIDMLTGKRISKEYPEDRNARVNREFYNKAFNRLNEILEDKDAVNDLYNQYVKRDHKHDRDTINRKYGLE
ncbi:MAG: hypothetical protein RIC35_02600 [Marinoscillum sp.]